jgi:membrane protease YdiL (CAAX protease family)
MSGIEPTTSRDVAKRTLVELFVAYTLITVTVWSSGGTQRVLFYVSGGWILLTSLFPRSTRELAGFKLSALRRSWWIIATALVGGGVALAGASSIGTLHLPGRIEQLPMRLVGYVVWSFVQQFILQDYFLQRVRRLVTNTWVAVATAALLFTLAHLPNPLLTIGALLWGIISCALFVRYRDLYSLGIAHAVLGLCVAFTVPEALHHGMRVGAGYRTYHPSHASHSTQPE